MYAEQRRDAVERAREASPTIHVTTNSESVAHQSEKPISGMWRHQRHILQELCYDVVHRFA